MTEQTVNLAGRHTQAEVVHRGPLTELLINVLELDHWLG
jgi:hypothetical protein